MFSGLQLEASRGARLGVLVVLVLDLYLSAVACAESEMIESIYLALELLSRTSTTSL